MPAPYGRRDWQQRTDRALGRTGRGNQQGRFLGARPVMNSPVNTPADTPESRDVGQLHKIDNWSIADTSDGTFHTTYIPMEDSWNLFVNGLRVHADEFSISDNTISISSPTDLFKGAATQGSPWDLEIQYDYLLAAPASLAGLTDNGASVSYGQSSSPRTLTLDAAPAASSAVLLTVYTVFSKTVTPTGLGATWTSLESLVVSGTETQQMFLGTGCTGGLSVITLTPNGNTSMFTAAVEVTDVTIAAEQSTTSVAATIGPLTAPAIGGIGFIHASKSGGVPAAVSESPGTWTPVDDGSNANHAVWAFELSGGQSASITLAGAANQTMALVAAV